MKRILITDMDGTLVDSMPFLRELAIALVAADGRSAEKMRQIYDATFGKPISEQYAEWNRQHEEPERLNIRRLSRLYESVHLLAARHFPFTDFARSLTMFQSDSKYTDWHFALVTSTHRRIVSHMPQIRNIHWDYVGGYDGDQFDKHAQIYAALMQTDIDPSNAVYVGDAPSDKVLAASIKMRYYFPTGTTIAEITGNPVFTGHED